MAPELHFTAWITPHTADQPPAFGHTSKQLWLPLVGPMAWLIWGTLAHELTHQATFTAGIENLARAHGIGPSTSHSGPVRRSLHRLTNYGLIAQHRDTHLVHLTAPPLRPRHLDRLTPALHELHRRTYPHLHREVS